MIYMNICVICIFMKEMILNKLNKIRVAELLSYFFFFFWCTSHDLTSFFFVIKKARHLAGLFL